VRRHGRLFVTTAQVARTHDGYRTLAEPASRSSGSRSKQSLPGGLDVFRGLVAGSPDPSASTRSPGEVPGGGTRLARRDRPGTNVSDRDLDVLLAQGPLRLDPISQIGATAAAPGTAMGVRIDPLPGRQQPPNTATARRSSIGSGVWTRHRPRHDLTIGAVIAGQVARRRLSASGRAGRPSASSPARCSPIAGSASGRTLGCRRGDEQAVDLGACAAVAAPPGLASPSPLTGRLLRRMRSCSVVVTVDGARRDVRQTDVG
jgi:hypothetical protein